jgi:hypothetical protein
MEICCNFRKMIVLMVSRLYLYLFLLLATATTASAAQVPPPPLPPGFRDLNAELTTAFNRHDLAAYEALLAPDLKVFDGDRQVAASRDQWLSMEKNAFRPGMAVHPVGVVFQLGSGGFYAMDQMTNGGVWWGRVIKYEVQDGKISVIRFLSGYSGGFPLLKPNSQQMGPMGE